METDILKLIYEVIDEVNEDLEDGLVIEKSPEAKIFGKGSALDSMGLVNFITLVEEKLEEETGDFISIADENAMSMVVSPFKTVSTLEEYIKTLIG